MKTYKAGDRVCVIESGECGVVMYARDDQSYELRMWGWAQSCRFWHSELEPAPEAAGDWDEAEFALACVTPGVEIPIFSTVGWDRTSIAAVAEHNDSLEDT